MPADFGIVLHPWTFAADGGALLERIVGEVAIDHLTVPAVTGEIAQFRPAGWTVSPFFHTEGGWHFPPQAQLYAGAGVRPRIARWVGSRDPLSAIREAANRHGLRVLFRLDLPAVRLVAEHPAWRVRSAWGDELPALGPCWWHPEFRELVRSTIANLGRYEPDGFELVGVDEAPSFAAQTLAPMLRPRSLGLATCFCGACRQTASAGQVDPEVAAGAVREAAAVLAEHTTSDSYRTLGEGAAPVLGQYVRARDVDLARWLDLLADGQAPRKLAAVQQMLAGPSGRRWPDLTARTRIHLVASLPRGSQGAGPAAEMPAGFPGLAFAIDGGPQDGPDKLVSFLARTAECNTAFYDFEGLEEARPEAVTWLRQAVRYARRTG